MKDPVKYYVVITDLVKNEQFTVGAWSIGQMTADLLGVQNFKQADFTSPYVKTHVYSIPFDFSGVYEIERTIEAIKHFSEHSTKRV